MTLCQDHLSQPVSRFGREVIKYSQNDPGHVYVLN